MSQLFAVLSATELKAISVMSLQQCFSHPLTHPHRNKKLLGAPGIATRSKDATRGSWPYYQ